MTTTEERCADCNAVRSNWVHKTPKDSEPAAMRNLMHPFATAIACLECGSTKAELIGFTNPNRYGHGKYCVNTEQCNRRKRERAMAEAILERNDFDWTVMP